MADETTPDAVPDATLVAAAPVKDSAAGEEGKRSTAQTIKDEAGKIGNQAAEKARAFADDGKTKATDALDEFSKLMHDAAGTVDDKLGTEYGKYARSAADGIANFAESLRSKQVDDLIGDATAFVKKSPAIAIGTAAAVGFVVARLIKSGVDAATDLVDRDDKPDTSDKG